MNSIDRFDFYFALVAFGSIAIICFIISGLSISYNEAVLLFAQDTIISKLALLCHNVFGGDFGLKIPNLIFHTLNLILIYLISNKILKYKRDSLLCVGIYALIPGVILQASLLNESIIVLCIVLLVCYVELMSEKISYIFFVIAVLVSPSAFILMLALFFYAIFKRKIKTMNFALICIAVNIYIYGIDIGGHPSGQFLDMFGELALLYSPPLFVYYIYTLYRNVTKEKINLLLCVSLTSLILSLFLSIRQEIDKEIFLFMSLCGIPLMIRQFLSDIRVRLPQFQDSYKNRFIIIILCLVLEAGLLIGSKYMYAFNKTGNLLDSFYITKELAQELNARGIKAVSTDGKTQARLKFYGIEKGGNNLSRVKSGGNLIIKYHNKPIARYKI